MTIKVILGIIAAAGLLLISASGFAEPVKGLLFSVTQPVLSPLTKLTLRTKIFFFQITTIKKQLQKNQELNQLLKALQAENALLQEVRQENERLRQLLALKRKSPFNTIAAEVVSRDPTGRVQAVIINRGTRDGISPGDAVIDEFGNLLGIIKEVFPQTSKFLLVTDGRIKIDARIIGKEALGIVTGSHGLGLNLDLISQKTLLEKNDKVVTSGLTGTLPAGLLIGYIDQPQSAGAELFQKASLIPAGQTRDFQFVLVITAF